MILNILKLLPGQTGLQPTEKIFVANMKTAIGEKNYLYASNDL